MYFHKFLTALEPRVCTRWDMQRYARQAYELGVRYIGGCCGFESYHIRAVSEELANERGKYPESSKKHDPWGEGLKMHTKPWVRARYELILFEIVFKQFSHFFQYFFFLLVSLS